MAGLDLRNLTLVAEAAVKNILDALPLSFPRSISFDSFFSGCRKNATASRSGSWAAAASSCDKGGDSSCSSSSHLEPLHHSPFDPSPSPTLLQLV